MSDVDAANAFFDAGGNFVDTACNYQDESSEEFLGEWMETRGIREQMVIATKVCSFAGYLGFEAVCNSPGRGIQYTTNLPFEIRLEF